MQEPDYYGGTPGQSSLISIAKSKNNSDRILFKILDSDACPFEVLESVILSYGVKFEPVIQVRAIQKFTKLPQEDAPMPLFDTKISEFIAKNEGKMKSGPEFVKMLNLIVAPNSCLRSPVYDGKSVAIAEKILSK